MSAVPASVPSASPVPALVPAPRSWRPRPGVHVVDERAELHTDPALAGEARRLRRLLGAGGGLDLEPAGRISATIRLRTDEALGLEAFALDVRPDRIEVRAGGPAGASYAIEALRQLLPPDAYRRAVVAPPPWEVPCGTIEDEPVLAWRGVLLDVVRHFLPVREVLRFIDLMAMHRLNMLQLHLSDDQGWRLEIDGFPELTSVASWRRASQVGAGDDAPDDGRPHGGFYSRADVAEIVAYAAERHVTIVPEIDLPGHVQALVAARPDLGAGLDRAPGGGVVAPEVWTRWGISDHVLGLSDHVLETVGAILDDVLDQFPGPVLALGGDESPKVRWRRDPDVRRRLAELGLTRDADAQNWLLDRLAQRARARGRRVLLWDEVLEGAPVRDAVVASWRGAHGIGTGLARGYDVVAAPADEVYLDYRESDDPREPVPVGVVTDVDRVLAFDPRRGVTGDEPGRLLGAQAHVWTEHVDSPRALDYRVFPRLAAFAEVVWRGGPSDPADFRSRLATHERRLEACGVELRRADGPQPWQERPGVAGSPLERHELDAHLRRLVGLAPSLDRTPLRGGDTAPRRSRVVR
ncbi:beta-N-acetylhexosaminidase [Luteimicrobium subarcticum]|uniref:beta-N-acetylhexosaminidase n=1 Tax=Luteimicrobium subarcticum TaxID=620910 RepID=A0A2M8WS00_9MICO|nr:beta-N-acetylhexosaminidase [Luteimicrobium subarcticum]PJI93720.1 hexosaminidase [Luteimicrobium subarcticum]